jgi:hypothetical protein
MVITRAYIRALLAGLKIQHSHHVRSSFPRCRLMGEGVLETRQELRMPCEARAEETFRTSRKNYSLHDSRNG